jgi:Tol biopolymer transport system component
MKKWFPVCAVLSLAALGVWALAAPQAEGVRAGGAQATGVPMRAGGGMALTASRSQLISRDGGFAAFASCGTNLVPHVTDGKWHIFLRDLKRGTTEVIDLSSTGKMATAECGELSLSSDGRFVVFTSQAANLAPGESNGRYGLFLRDRKLAITERVNLSAAGGPGDGHPRTPRVSDDGRFVAFDYYANNTGDVYLRDRQKQTTERISLDQTGKEIRKPNLRWTLLDAMSPDGRFLLYSSHFIVPAGAKGECATYLRGRTKGVTRFLGEDLLEADITPDGRLLLWARTDKPYSPASPRTSARTSLWTQDLATGARECVSVNNAGESANGWCGNASLSADGRFVVFQSEASNLVPGVLGSGDNPQVYLRDRRTGKTELINVNLSGKPGNGPSAMPSISADGRFVCFGSLASDLVPGDTNGAFDAFVRDRLLGVTTRVNVSSAPHE